MRLITEPLDLYVSIKRKKVTDPTEIFTESKTSMSRIAIYIAGKKNKEIKLYA